MKRFDIDEPNRIAQILQLLKNDEPSSYARMTKRYPTIFSEPAAPAGKVDESLISAKRRQMGNMFKGGNIGPDPRALQGMAKSKTTWKKGQSGNPAGRPRMGEGIVKGLVDELNARGQAGKLHKILIKRALDSKADWRLIIAVYDYFLKVYQHERDNDLETRLEALERRLNEEKH